MRLLKKTAAMLVALGALAAPAFAATYNVSFTGEIESLNDGANATVGSIGSITVGDAVMGGFTLDTSVLGSVSGTVASYGNAVSNFSATVDGILFSSVGSTSLSVYDNSQQGSSAPLIDAIRTFGAVSGPVVGGLTAGGIQFALGGTDTSVLSNLAIPTPSLFGDLLAADTLAGNWNYVTFSDGSDARWRVDSVTLTPSAVPLPAAAPMLIAGLGAFAAMRRRKSRR